MTPVIALAAGVLALAALIAWTVWYGRHSLATDRALDAAAVVARRTGAVECAFPLAPAGPALLPYVVGCPTQLDLWLAVTDEYAQARVWVADYKAELHQVEQRMAQEIDLSFDALARFGGYPGGMIELDGVRLLEATVHQPKPVSLSTLSDSTKEIPCVPSSARPRRSRRLPGRQPAAHRLHPARA